ncbi:MAG: A/G-specific adenine glycosylase [Ginsengibacter sp.]
MIKKNFKNGKYFTRELLSWNATHNNRPMPWKQEKDAYKIWISEIILQQTQVKQGLGYYQRFVENFPTITALAHAEDEKVFKLWEGLGYYSRCRNLLYTARLIVNDLEGIFPVNYENILALKGVGPYTAAAIASFAYNHPYAVIDGNVFRVLARFFGISQPIDCTTGKKLFIELAHNLLDKIAPATYNQAIMDFGATICKPKQPLCIECPLQKKCFAFKNNLVGQLPVKEKSIIKTNRYLNYLVIIYDGKVFVRQRITKDIWHSLNEFVLIETSKVFQLKNIKQDTIYKAIDQQGTLKIIETSKLMRQQLTHLNVSGIFIIASLKNFVDINSYKLVPLDELSQLPFPKFITAFLKDYTVSLNLPQAV